MYGFVEEGIRIGGRGFRQGAVHTSCSLAYQATPTATDPLLFIVFYQIGGLFYVNKH